MGQNWVVVGVPSVLGVAEAYLHTKWHLDPSSYLAATDMGRKLGSGGEPPFVGGGAGSPSNT